MKKWLKLFIFLAFVCLSFKPSMAMGQLFFFENELKGKPAHDFTLDTLNSQGVNFTQFRDGKDAIIFFWATWCPHCRVALEDMNRKRDEFTQKGIKLALIDVGESEQVVRKYAEKNKIELEIFLDKKSELSDPYGLIGVPTFIFVGKDGVVKDVQHSLPDNYEKVFQN